MTARVTPGPVAVALFFGALIATQNPAPVLTAVEGPRRVKVLFLRNANTQSDSSRFAAMLNMALAQYGFNISDTTDPADRRTRRP